jgi:hypothetical protein
MSAITTPIKMITAFTETLLLAFAAWRAAVSETLRKRTTVNPSAKGQGRE